MHHVSEQSMSHCLSGHLESFQLFLSCCNFTVPHCAVFFLLFALSALNKLVSSHTLFEICFSTYNYYTPFNNSQSIQLLSWELHNNFIESKSFWKDFVGSQYSSAISCSQIIWKPMGGIVQHDTKHIKYIFELCSFYDEIISGSQPCHDGAKTNVLRLAWFPSSGLV
jgi:hypothetical protein